MCQNMLRFVILISILGGGYMCDVAKYSKMYKDIKNLQPEDTLQLVLESKTKDEKEFFELIGNYLLQKKQKEVIQGNLF